MRYASVCGALMMRLATGCGRAAPEPAPTAPARQPAAEVIAAAPERACGDVAELEGTVLGVPAAESRPLRDRITAAQAELDRHTIAAALGHLFNGLRRGDVDAALVRTTHEYERHELLPQLMAVVGRAEVCPVAIVSQRYSGGHDDRVWVEVQLRTAAGPVGPVEMEVSRGEHGEWLFAVGHLAEGLEELVRLDRAANALRERIDVRIEHLSRGDWQVEQTWIGGAETDQERLLCLDMHDDSTGCIVRCFQSRWPISGTEASVTDDGFVCVWPGDRGRDDGDVWVLQWPDGEFHTGSCGYETARPTTLATAIRRVPAPFDMSAWDRVEVASLTDRVSALSTDNHYRVCVHAGTDLICSPSVRLDASLASVELRDAYVAVNDVSSIGWVAVVRHREEMGGAEMHAGDDSLVVFRLDRGELRQHGVLPLGGYSAERLEHEPDVRTIWSASHVLAGSIRIDPTGCAVVGRPQSLDRITVRGRGRSTARRGRGSLPAAGDYLDGASAENVYEAAARDTSGTWSFEPDGGFRRIAACPDRGRE